MLILVYIYISLGGWFYFEYSLGNKIYFLDILSSFLETMSDIQR